MMHFNYIRIFYVILLVYFSEAHPEMLMQLLQMPFHNQMQFQNVSQFSYQNNYNHPILQQQLQQNTNFINEQSDGHVERMRPAAVAHGIAQQRQPPINFQQDQNIEQQLSSSKNSIAGSEQTTSNGGSVIPTASDHPRAYHPTQAHIDFGNTLLTALNPPNLPQEIERRQQQTQRQHEYSNTFGFAPGTPILFCGYGLPIPQYDTPHKKCVPWHPLCGITFTCIMDV